MKKKGEICAPSGKSHDVTGYKPSVQKNFARRRIYDTRLALSLIHSGVTEFATANPKDFAGLAFRRVWNPLEI